MRDKINLSQYLKESSFDLKLPHNSILLEIREQGGQPVAIIEKNGEGTGKTISFLISKPNTVLPRGVCLEAFENAGRIGDIYFLRKSDE